MSETVHVHPEPAVAPSRVRRASWGAIFAGMFVTIILQIMFTLLGIAVGLAHIQKGQNPAESIGTSSGIWLLVTGLVSIWVGSCVAGRLCGGPRQADGMLHGIVTWSVSMVAMFALLATTIGAVLGGTVSLVGGAISSTGGGEETGQQAIASLPGQVRDLLPQAAKPLPPTGRGEGRQGPGQLSALAQQDSDLALALGRMASQGGASKDPQDRDQVLTLLTTKHNLSQEDAQNLVNEWDQQSQQARAQAAQKTEQVGQAVAQGASRGALWGFIALVLGLIVAALGGLAGTASLPRPVEV